MRALTDRATGTAESGDDLDRWLDWALRYADRINLVAARRRSLAERKRAYFVMSLSP